MHDDDLSPLEQTQRIVDAERARQIDSIANSVAQILGIFEGLGPAMARLSETLEKIRPELAAIANHETEAIAFMEDQMRS